MAVALEVLSRGGEQRLTTGILIRIGDPPNSPQVDGGWRRREEVFGQFVCAFKGQERVSMTIGLWDWAAVYV